MQHPECTGGLVGRYWVTEGRLWVRVRRGLDGGSGPYYLYKATEYLSKDPEQVIRLKVVQISLED